VWLEGPAADSRNAVFLAMGMLNVALEVSAPDALALLRGHAFAVNRTVDDIAQDVVNRRIAVHELRVGSNQ
jgi:AmiR/NasT family two-component response regulator